MSQPRSSITSRRHLVLLQQLRPLAILRKPGRMDRPGPLVPAALLRGTARGKPCQFDRFRAGELIRLISVVTSPQARFDQSRVRGRELRPLLVIPLRSVAARIPSALAVTPATPTSVAPAPERQD